MYCSIYHAVFNGSVLIFRFLLLLCCSLFYSCVIYLLVCVLCIDYALSKEIVLSLSLLSSPQLSFFLFPNLFHDCKLVIICLFALIKVFLQLHV